LVAVAVLLDGGEAGQHLCYDKERGEILQRAAEELAQDELEMRLPFIGTLYREALKDMSEIL
jgi:hypothetical protein